MRVLLVEDNFIVGLEIKQRLTEMGCEVLGPVAGVADAHKLLATSTPDGAILDYSLRHGTSTPIAETLIEKGCPFVFISGYTDPPGLPESLAGHRRLSKPINSDTLRSVIRSFEELDGINAGRSEPSE